MTLFILLSIGVALGNMFLAIRLWYLVQWKYAEVQKLQRERAALTGELDKAKLYNRVLAKKVIDQELDEL